MQLTVEHSDGGVDQDSADPKPPARLQAASDLIELGFNMSARAARTAIIVIDVTKPDRGALPKWKCL
ncbi:MAG TPA: hypothetical protein VKT99_09140 [Xanthobacteraceae bacterium]|nr:hypothetical protein [Xanthobacteraceae bacterium]